VGNIEFFKKFLLNNFFWSGTRPLHTGMNRIAIQPKRGWALRPIGKAISSFGRWENSKTGGISMRRYFACCIAVGVNFIVLAAANAESGGKWELVV
jgi:hypothetical protein